MTITKKKQVQCFSQCDENSIVCWQCLQHLSTAYGMHQRDKHVTNRTWIENILVKVDEKILQQQKLEPNIYH